MADINLGHATAYGYARSKGFSGTEEEFAQLMANYGTVGQTATQAAQTATTKASEAASSASNAASSATNAANSAQEAADIVESIIDDTLTQEGKAADAKVAGDRIGELKDDLTDLDGVIGNYIYSVIPSAGRSYVHIPIADSVPTGTTIYAQALTVPADVDYILLIGQYSGQRNLIDLEDGEPHLYTTVLTYTNVEVLYHLTTPADGNTKYSVVCIKSDDPASIAKDLFETKTEIAKTSALVDSPFAVEISNKFKGIVAFEFLITDPTDASFSAINNQQYRVTNIYYKDAFYLYMSLQRYADGSWSDYDSVLIFLADAPTETALMVLDSSYGRFRVAIIPGLMTAGRATSVEYLIKNTAVNPFITKLQSDLGKYVPYDSYVVKDTISNRVTVKKDGTGDFTTISAAYAAINKKSSFFNQYEICVYPGTYNEINLICPPYTHTHGMFPNTVTVTSEGETGTLPVFDQKSFPSKLSNMKIVSATGYCIHVDNPLIHSVVNRGLYCKKVYSLDVSDFRWRSISQSAIIGMGAQPSGMNVIFDGCVFEDGAVTCHSASSADNNADYYLAFNNCTLVNAQFQLSKAGNTGASTWGNLLCEINNLKTARGQSEPGIWLTYGEAVTGLPYNFGWQIIGGNINTAIGFYKFYDSSAPDCWENIHLTEKSYIQAKAAITKGQWITDGMIPATANEKAHNIIGVALENASSGDTCQIWSGNAFMLSGANGEYGIGSDGNLSASATEKIGKIISNVFYRY